MEGELKVPREKTVTDYHVHSLVFGGASSLAGVRGLFLKRLLRRLGVPARAADLEAAYHARLSHLVRRSIFVRRAVVFGLDGRYDSGGRPVEVRSLLTIPNERVLANIAGLEGLCFGASINPARADAADELERCAAAGAVIVKVLPNTQGFDPARRRYRPFYRRMAELGLPLLVHSGMEFVLGAADQSLGDPARLETALAEGVAVIAAHGGGTGLGPFEHNLPVLRRLARRYDNFFIDTAALTLPTRMAMVFLLRRHPLLRGRVVFGTDLPLPQLAAPFVFSLAPRRLLEIRRIENPFDRALALMVGLGLPPAGQAPLEALVKRA